MCEKSTSKIPIDKMAPDLSLAELSNYVVPFSEVQLDTELGKGAFSVVYVFIDTCMCVYMCVHVFLVCACFSCVWLAGRALCTYSH